MGKFGNVGAYLFAAVIGRCHRLWSKKSEAWASRGGTPNKWGGTGGSRTKNWWRGHRDAGVDYRKIVKLCRVRAVLHCPPSDSYGGAADRIAGPFTALSGLSVDEKGNRDDHATDCAYVKIGTKTRMLHPGEKRDEYTRAKWNGLAARWKRVDAEECVIRECAKRVACRFKILL